jgi:hypothetical protein
MVKILCCLSVWENIKFLLASLKTRSNGSESRVRFSFVALYFSVYSAGFRNNFQYHRLPWNNLYSRRRLFVSRNKLSEVSNRKWMETKSQTERTLWELTNRLLVTLFVLSICLSFVWNCSEFTITDPISHLSTVPSP